MTYNKGDESYLGQTTDMTQKIVDGFLVDEYIHIVYNLDAKDQYSTSHSIQEIEEDIDGYMWTPYSIFVARIEN